MSVSSRRAVATSVQQVVQKHFRDGEILVSRNPFRSNRPQHTSPQFADQGDPAGDAIIGQAHALFGSEAATAVAYCAVLWTQGSRMRRASFAASPEYFAGSGTRMLQAVSCGGLRL
ncbi:hypothetical protein ASC96_18125 [Rhizobium sp. Root1204]|nr:hypothetical protein ASC96_18125 [Rhizobium sp. Root1204]